MKHTKTKMDDLLKEKFEKRIDFLNRSIMSSKYKSHIDIIASHTLAWLKTYIISVYAKEVFSHVSL